MRAQKFSSVSGFILAGGESRRMGRPKAQLRLGGATLLERQVRLLASVCGQVVVVGANVDAPSGVPLIPDIFPGRGPLGGIHAALAASRTEFNLIVACDLPFLSRRLLLGLVHLATATGADVTVPEDRARRTVPVCAVYRKAIQGIVRIRLANGLNKADGYFRSVRVHRVAWSQIRRAGFPSHIFDNINRPEDFAEARRRLGD
jgi:molybdopterin-guanine dinucleotide biosynthesis protein A